MKDAKWTGNAGTDQWNVCFSHSTHFGNPGVDELQVAVVKKRLLAISAADNVILSEAKNLRSILGTRRME